MNFAWWHRFRHPQTARRVVIGQQAPSAQRAADRIVKCLRILDSGGSPLAVTFRVLP
jgi:hypothetical protein